MKRWKCTINYRTKNGIVDVIHDIEEIEELQNLVERGADWNTISNIVITLNRRSNENITIEDS